MSPLTSSDLAFAIERVRQSGEPGLESLFLAGLDGSVAVYELARRTAPLPLPELLDAAAWQTKPPCVLIVWANDARPEDWPTLAEVSAWSRHRVVHGGPALDTRPFDLTIQLALSFDRVALVMCVPEMVAEWALVLEPGWVVQFGGMEGRTLNSLTGTRLNR